MGTDDLLIEGWARAALIHNIHAGRGLGHSTKTHFIHEGQPLCGHSYQDVKYTAYPDSKKKCKRCILCLKTWTHLTKVLNKIEAR